MLCWINLDSSWETDLEVMSCEPGFKSSEDTELKLDRIRSHRKTSMSQVFPSPFMIIILCVVKLDFLGAFENQKADLHQKKSDLVMKSHQDLEPSFFGLCETLTKLPKLKGNSLFK